MYTQHACHAIPNVPKIPKILKVPKIYIQAIFPNRSSLLQTPGTHPS
jgi:hypothetical protein